MKAPEPIRLKDIKLVGAVEFTPVTTCEHCYYIPTCRQRVLKGQWVMCEVPDEHDLMLLKVIQDEPEWPIVRPYESRI